LQSPEPINTVAFGEQQFVRSRAVVSRSLDGETLVVPVRGKVGDLASIYNFNGTGSLIWQLLEKPRTAADLIASLEQEYEISQEAKKEQLQKDVEHFLHELALQGLIDAISTDTHMETQIGAAQISGTQISGTKISGTKISAPPTAIDSQQKEYAL
jgi:hypothetical protein